MKTAAPGARRRTVLGALAAAGASALTGCAAPTLSDYAAQRPAFDFRAYFDGAVQAHGVVADRSGKVLRRFVATMRCTWSGDEGTLDEDFVYDDGERQKRVWRVRRQPDGRYTGTADDVVGQAIGAASGPAFNWRYTLKVPVGGSVYQLDFDDWMFQIDERIVLNQATMSKFGVRVGSVTLSFRKG
jgi:hypothetical protein